MDLYQWRKYKDINDLEWLSDMAYTNLSRELRDVQKELDELENELKIMNVRSDEWLADEYEEMIERGEHEADLLEKEIEMRDQYGYEGTWEFPKAEPLLMSW